MVDEFFNQKPDKPLYHYTDQRGLLGILTSKQIWLSHTQYLNDCREFLQAIDIIHAEIKILIDNLSDLDEKNIASEMHDDLESIHKTNVLVCSFSEDRDSLSQWRAYGGSSGYSIGFSTGTILSDPNETGVLLGKCIYDENVQRKLLCEIVKKVFEKKKYPDHIEESDNEDEQPNQLIPVLLKVAPLIKHPSFHSEKEWRLIALKPCTSKEFGFREGKSTIVPFYRQSLLNARKELSLHEVVVGPTPHPELSISAVNSLLIKERRKGKDEGVITLSGYTRSQVQPFIPVNLSGVPFRNW